MREWRSGDTAVMRSTLWDDSDDRGEHSRGGPSGTRLEIRRDALGELLRLTGSHLILTVMIDRSYRRRRHSRDGDDDERFPYLEKSYKVFTIGADGSRHQPSLRSPNSARHWRRNSTGLTSSAGGWPTTSRSRSPPPSQPEKTTARPESRRQPSPSWRCGSTARACQETAADARIRARIPRPGPPRRAPGPLALLPALPRGHRAKPRGGHLRHPPEPGARRGRQRPRDRPRPHSRSSRPRRWTAKRNGSA